MRGLVQPTEPATIPTKNTQELNLSIETEVVHRHSTHGTQLDATVWPSSIYRGTRCGPRPFTVVLGKAGHENMRYFVVLGVGHMKITSVLGTCQR